MLKKYVALLCVVTMVLGCFALSGCKPVVKTEPKMDKTSWNGVYTGKQPKKYDEDQYVTFKITIEDGYMIISAKDDYQELNFEDNFKMSKDGKTISIPFVGDSQTKGTAYFRKLGNNYRLNLKDKSNVNLYQCTLEKNK